MIFPSPPSRPPPRWRRWRSKSRITTNCITRKTRPKYPTPHTMTCARVTARCAKLFRIKSRPTIPKKGSVPRLLPLLRRSRMPSRCSRSATLLRMRMSRILSRVSVSFCNCPKIPPSPFWPNRRLTVYRLRCVMRKESWCKPRRAATAQRAKTSPPTREPSKTCRMSWPPPSPPLPKCGAKSTLNARTLWPLTPNAIWRASRYSPIRATPLPEACGSWTPALPPGVR